MIWGFSFAAFSGSLHCRPVISHQSGAQPISFHPQRGWRKYLSHQTAQPWVQLTNWTTWVVCSVLNQPGSQHSFGASGNGVPQTYVEGVWRRGNPHEKVKIYCQTKKEGVWVCPQSAHCWSLGLRNCREGPCVTGVACMVLEGGSMSSGLFPLFIRL